MNVPAIEFAWEDVWMGGGSSVRAPAYNRARKFMERTHEIEAVYRWWYKASLRRSYVHPKIALYFDLIQHHISRLQEYLSRPAKSVRYQTHDRSVLPSIINGKKYHALPDTGVTPNVISLEEANSIGAHIDKKSRRLRTFQDATGVPFTSCGVTKLNFSFEDEPERTWKCDFIVVKKCAAPIVLGRSFIEETKLYTRFKHYLVKAALHVRDMPQGLEKVWRLMLMESPQKKMNCFVDDKMVPVFVDSGSDRDLASLEYANSQGWDITKLPEDEGFVILASGRVMKVLGYADKQLKIGKRREMRRFYILDGLTSKVILGDETIDDFDIFSEQRAFVGEEMASEGDWDFRMLQWVDKFNAAEVEVDRILGGQRAASITLRRRGRRRLFMRRDKSQTPGMQDMMASLKHRLYEVDEIEGVFRNSAAEKMMFLTDDALEKEKESDRKRRERHAQLRQKISQEIDKLDKANGAT